MKSTKIFIFLFVLLSVSVLFAEELGYVHGTMIGGEPAKSWEDGGQDFFVMFNSNIDDKIIFANEDVVDGVAKNPQGDTCLEEGSSFTLNGFHIPEDAIIEKAYLVWMGAVDPEKLNDPTDNKVHLSFTQTVDPNVAFAQDIQVGETGKTLDAEPTKIDGTNIKEFEGIKFEDEVYIGCSETASGETQTMELGYFTYRKDITDFFNQIYEINKAAEHEEGTGEYYGTYTFSDLECTEHDAYRCKTTMVSAWSIFFIYRSKYIRPKKIYFYDGLSAVYGKESVANVSGFELPLNPSLRITTMIAEGDPSLYNNALKDTPEGIFLLRKNEEDQTEKFKIKDKCNPMTSTYVEVFNSVSSIVNWNPKAADEEKIMCVSGPEDEGVNYGIDVDTFLLESENSQLLQDYIKKGQTSLDIQLSVNQDSIFTNFMVLSVDIKGSSFDIPDEDEKYSCSCPASDAGINEYYYCPYVNTSKEFYYLVKVQNWGEDETGKVTISDDLDPQLEYVAGTTEMATNCRASSSGDQTKKGDVCDDWVEIPDKDGGKFPLSGSGVKISDKMRTCSKNSCPDKILVRYKVRPKKGIAKNYVFSNIAVLADANSETPYKTNLSYPLKLRPTACVTECTSPTQEMCGGVKNERECGEAGLPGCPNGYVCENFKCVDNADSLCSDATVEVAIGKNSPQSDNSIIVSRDNGGEPLVVGQFTLQASDCEKDKVFNFNDLRVQFNTKSDSNFVFSDYELIWDVDGNGLYNENVDSIVSEKAEENTNYVYFSLKNNAKKYLGKSLNFFIIRAKINYKSEDIKPDTSFFFYLGKSALTSNINVADAEIKFAEFKLEPTGDYFIATIGQHDPSVPSISEMNSNIPVMQIKTKSIGKENSIKKFKVKVPNSSVKFGDKDGITGISLWLDKDNDGKGDEKIAEKTSFSSTENSITFESGDFKKDLKYSADEEKYLVIYVDFNMAKSDPAMMGKISIPKGGITLKESANVYELPLNSKSFVYACQKGDENCREASKSKSSGCAVLEVESDNTNIIVIAAVLSAAAMLGFALLRKKIF